MDRMRFHTPGFCCTPCKHLVHAFCYKMPPQYLSMTHKLKRGSVRYLNLCDHRANCQCMMVQISCMSSDHILLEEVAGSTYVLHYVETLCVVWPVLHTTVSSSTDTAPGSLSKPAHCAHIHNECWQTNP